MLEVIERLGLRCEQSAVATVTLSHEQRERGRLKLVSDQGEEVRVFLERGKALLVGEYLRSRCGQIIQIKGAVEEVAHASCEDWKTFSRACYHLGNRHTKVEVGDRWLRIKPDHVLEDMLNQIGLVVSLEQAVFNPENGAYAHGHHHH